MFVCSSGPFKLALMESPHGRREQLEISRLAAEHKDLPGKSAKQLIASTP